ncbi:peptidoglycan D,D-transpeptidase FtsI family protein [Alicyclobacillus herbarius]|uniref:peptidoglycan D,D-transpeptidase FtsI family protein n=1 Tax=Alicyclobacillus herbarius TaxID=122960 RepID=UPI0005588815|nr:penicillin-binding protein 2 [Alicyclobacillus herbarius]
MNPKRPSRHRRRLWILQAGCVLALASVAVRIQIVQHVFGGRLLAQADKAQTVTTELLAPRGDILDAQGNRLAYDMPAYMMDIRVKDFADRTKLAQILSKDLGVKLTEAKSLVTSQKYTWIRWPQPISETQREAIVSDLGAWGKTQSRAAKTGTSHTNVDFTQSVTFTPTEERFYPNGSFAANVLGYVDHHGQGQGGLELQYNRLLSGTNGLIRYTQDGAGFPLQWTMQVEKPPKSGDDLQLTLDSTIQGFVEEKMDELVKEYHPEHASIIVTNPNTGAILGMASRPTFNPNTYWNASNNALSNWAVNSAFEPGSTFKVIVLAAALTTGVIHLSDTFESGHLQVAGRIIYDWNRIGWGRITFQQALEESSNVGFATIALKLGWSNLLSFMHRFGLLDKTGIDLPGEANSLIFPQSERGKLQLATSGFGQGIAVTPIQQVAAVGAIANGGKLMKPYLVQKVIDHDSGKVIQSIHPTVVDPQVVPKSVANTVSHIMVLDVSKGIDKAGYLPGYDVAGKTGTAQAVDPKTGKYYSDRFIVSFIGYAPGWDPKVEVYVTLYWPKTAAGNQWGSTVATPAARDILKECMEYYHIAPRADTSKGTTKQANQSAPRRTDYVQMPDVTGQPLSAAKAALSKQGFQVQTIGGHGTVARQWPSAGLSLAKGTTVYLYAPASGDSLHMPDLTGASLRDAGNILAVLGLHIQAQGVGFVRTQSVAPDAPIKPGQTVHVTCSPTSG